MPVKTTQIQVQTRGDAHILDLTDRAAAAVSESGLKDGILTVFVPGSTAGVTTLEYEPGLVHDLQAAIERLVPKGISYQHNTRWGDDNGFSHVRSALLGPSLTVPFSGGKLMHGTWQQIVLMDFDNRPRQRKVVFQVMGE
ncbi:MAG: YjbQ family protein [Acidobacteria bacterium]|nr:YjbQ family protein [Acidobacteriota bacterium]